MNQSPSGITERNKRSIRDIKRERSRQKEKRGAGDDGESGGGNDGTQPPHENTPNPRNSEKTATYGLWFVGLVGIAFLFFLFSVVFAETVVTVNPKTAELSIDQQLTASNDPATAGVGFSSVSATEEVELTATSTGSEYREAAASGEITIYNEFGDEAIRLVPNTRFSVNGNIYRTDTAVTVPAQESEGSPGTVTAEITAEAVGPEYNTGENTRFSIPGFSGTQYEGAVYGESTAGMRGGVAGNVPVLASSTATQLREEADSQLRAELERKLAGELPEGFFFYSASSAFSSEIIGSEDTSTSTSRLTVAGTLSAVAFDESRLSDFVARAYSDDISEEADVLVEDIAEFEFALVDPDSFTLGESQTFEFSLAGDSRVVWQFDERGLVRDLRGLQKDQLDEVLENYPGIQGARIETRPFWKQTLPGDAAEIDVETVIN